MKEMWGSNSELSRYEYPIDYEIDDDKNIVYFFCTAHNEGCKFYIKLKKQVTYLNEPCQTMRDSSWKSRLC